MAATRRTLEQQVQDLQEQLRDLTLEMQRHKRRDQTPPRYRPEDDDDTDDYSTSGDYNPYGRHHHDRRQNNDIKVDVPEYDGRLDPDVFVEWLRTVERVFDYKQTDEAKKVKLVALKLRKYASTWWDNVCRKRDRQGKEKVKTWSKMKKLLKQKFMPTFYVQESFSKLHALKQGNRPAEEYSQDFEHLIMKCDVDEDDPQTLVRYLGGLEPRIANVIELQSYTSLAELTLLAHKVDSQQKLHGKAEATLSVNKMSVTTSASSSLTTPITAPSKPLDLPKGSSKHTRRCFKCHMLGHIMSECPNKRVITITEFESLVEPKYNEEISEQHIGEIVELGPDEGECLVVRRALNGTAVQDSELQREALFRTRCTIRDKVCSLVIDSGSCTNVASQRMIDKLNLPAEPHPSPYDIHWLNQEKGIRVINRVLLSFSVGQGYKDEIWCAVIPMDACHVLLGRPWLFDRRVLHDGYKNTYSFDKDGKKITLLPMGFRKTHDPRTLIFTKSYELMEVKKATAAYQELCVPVYSLGFCCICEPVFGHDYPSLRSNFFEDQVDVSKESTRQPGTNDPPDKLCP